MKGESWEILRKETDTTLVKNISVSGSSAAYDAYCKKLLSEKNILAYILQSCIEEYQGLNIKEIADKYIEGTPQVALIGVHPDETNISQIHGIKNEDTTITEGYVTYDVRFFAIAPGKKQLINLIVNIEAQKDFYPGYPLMKRAIYYCARIISSQYGAVFTKSEYGKIQKVYSIWICANPPRQRRNTITLYKFKEHHLIGEIKEKIENYDLMCAVMICLGDSSDKNYSGVLKLLDVLFSTRNRDEKIQTVEEFGIPATEKLKKEVEEMCNLSENIFQKGVEKGESRLAVLIGLLINNNLIDEISKVSTDQDYREELYSHYGI